MGRREDVAHALRVISDCGGLFQAVVDHYPAKKGVSSISLDTRNRFHKTDFIEQVCCDIEKKIQLSQLGLYDLTLTDKFTLDMMIEHILFHNPSTRES